MRYCATVHLNSSDLTETPILLGNIGPKLTSILVSPFQSPYIIRQINLHLSDLGQLFPDVNLTRPFHQKNPQPSQSQQPPCTASNAGKSCPLSSPTRPSAANAKRPSPPGGTRPPRPSARTANPSFPTHRPLSLPNLAWPPAPHPSTSPTQNESG